MSIEAMKMALAKLDHLWEIAVDERMGTDVLPEIKALHQAIEQAEKQEPVAWADKYDIEREGHDFYVNRQQPAKDGVPLYTAPPQREWVGLATEDIEKIHYDIKCKGMGAYSTDDIYRAIEAKLKEKNT